MNRPFLISIAILVFTTIGLALGTFMLHDAEQRGGQAGYVGFTPATNVSFDQVPAIPCVESPGAIQCKENKCSMTCTVVTNDSCHLTPSKYLKDTMLVSAIILNESRETYPDLSVMEMEYFSASNGKEMILARHEMVGIYLIERSSDSQMEFMNFFDRGVEVKFSGEAHNGMPDICVTNFDQSKGFFQWNGTTYQLEHEERSCV